jgi:cytochrome c oxidase subunit 1
MGNHTIPFPLTYLNVSKGILSWLLATDHKRIGILYLVSISLGFIVSGLFGLLIRAELIAPGKTIIDPHAYNIVMTVHGAGMIFLFIIPGLSASLGNFCLPLMIGAKDVAFPRLNLASWYFFMLGMLIIVATLFSGGVDTGWTFYPPYSLKSLTAVSQVLFGAFLIGFSSIFTGINFMATIHKLKVKGITWGNMNLFPWALYATAIIQIFATPVLGITLVLVIVERLFGTGIFDPAKGGDPLLFQHLFWFYSHPAVYVMAIPAFGVISEIIPVFSKQRIFGQKAIAYSFVAIALLSFIVWAHHLFIAGISKPVVYIHSLLTTIISVPTGVGVFCWIATLYKGKIELKTPMLYALAFIFLFLIGGLTGVFLGLPGSDIHLSDTYFVVAHFHYTMMGGVVTATLAGIYFWFPKMTGRMYNEFWSKIGFLLYFVGYNITFLPMFSIGVQGMMRRYYDYPPEFASIHFISSLGAFILAAAFIVILLDLIISTARGEKAGNNPWGAKSLEWQTSSPPPPENFEKVLEIPKDYNPYGYGAK